MTDPHEPENIDEAPATGPEVEQSIADAPTPDAEAQFVAETTEHSRKMRLGWQVLAGVVAVALLVTGIAYALLRSDVDPESGPAAPVATAIVPSRTGTGTPGTDSSPTASAVGTATSGTEPTGSSSATGTRSAARSETPAKPGAKLIELKAPPSRTVAMLVVPKGFTAATYAIKFQPFGWGPGGSEGGRLLIRIVSSKPTNASATQLDKDFAGRNAAVWCSPQVAASLSKGGTYTGTLQVRPQADVGTLYLLSAAPAK